MKQMSHIRLKMLRKRDMKTKKQSGDFFLQQVSKCHRCRIRYDAVPKESEWGVAEFTCGNCGNVFK